MNRKSILFVCAGNTCRSPMAEALASVYLPQFRVDSAGVSAGGGEPAARNAIDAIAAIAPYNARRRIRRHKSKSLRALTCCSYDFIVAMTPSLADSIALRGQLPTTRIVKWSVPDPFGQSAQVYQATCEQISENLARFARQYVTIERPSLAARLGAFLGRQLASVLSRIV